MLWHRQAIFESKGDKLSSSAECRIRTHQGLWNPIFSRLNACWQNDWAIEDQAKTWTRQPVPMIREHSAHSTPQPFGIRTWLWRYTYLLLLISMLWHRQAIFESKGDKLSSSAECRIRTHQGPWNPIFSRLNACWQNDWAIEDQAKTWTRQPVPMIREHSAHSTPQPFGIRTIITIRNIISIILSYHISLDEDSSMSMPWCIYYMEAFYTFSWNTGNAIYPCWRATNGQLMKKHCKGLF